METKDRTFAFRLTSAQHRKIKEISSKAKMTMTDYILSCALQKEIKVIDFKPVAGELKAIGKNLNQLTTLAHMGRIQTASLESTKEKLTDVYNALERLISDGDSHVH